MKYPLSLWCILPSKIILSDVNAKSIFIPAGFAHGFLALKKENIIYYTCTNYRSAKHWIYSHRPDNERIQDPACYRVF